MAASFTPVEDERYSLPYFPASPSGAELFDHLRTKQEQYLLNHKEPVNRDLLWVKPWDIPGIMEGTRREKYFVTDHTGIMSTSAGTMPGTVQGYWKERDLGWGSPPDESNGAIRFASLMTTTYDFHNGDSEEGNNITNWIMNVYFLKDAVSGTVKDDLALCHIFENNHPNNMTERTERCM